MSIKKYTVLAIVSLVSSACNGNNNMANNDDMGMETPINLVLKQEAYMAEKAWKRVEKKKEHGWDELQTLLEEIHACHQQISGFEQNATTVDAFLRKVKKQLLKHPHVCDDQNARDAMKEIEAVHSRVRYALKRVEKTYEDLKDATEAQRRATEKLSKELDDLMNDITDKGQRAVDHTRHALETNPKGKEVADEVYEHNRRELAIVAKKEARANHLD